MGEFANDSPKWFQILRGEQVSTSDTQKAQAAEAFSAYVKQFFWDKVWKRQRERVRYVTKQDAEESFHEVMRRIAASLQERFDGWSSWTHMIRYLRKAFVNQLVEKNKTRRREIIRIAEPIPTGETSPQRDAIDMLPSGDPSPECIAFLSRVLDAIDKLDARCSILLSYMYFYEWESSQLVDIVRVLSICPPPQANGDRIKTYVRRTCRPNLVRKMKELRIDPAGYGMKYRGIFDELYRHDHIW